MKEVFSMEIDFSVLRASLYGPAYRDFRVIDFFYCTFIIDW